MSRLESVIDQIRLARIYSKGLIQAVGEADWFRMPEGSVTHVAWQVGHLAAAEYYLTAVRVRGRSEADAELISDEFLEQFGKGSVPQADPAAYPEVGEIRNVFDAVHAEALKDLPQLEEAILDEPAEPPHPMFSTRFGAISFCPMHEMIHAGQIGLLRRILGGDPLR